MTDMRPKEIRIEREGRVYDLRCNFATLAAVDFDLGGVNAALKRGATGCAIIFAEAMLNECAERHGWPERYDRAATLAFLDDCGMSCGKLIVDIHALVDESLTVDEPTPGEKAKSTAAAQAEEQPKN